jgi:hypothetical protein
MQAVCTAHKSTVTNSVMARKFNVVSDGFNRSRLCNLAIISSLGSIQLLFRLLRILIQVFIYMSAELNSPEASYSEQQYGNNKRIQRETKNLILFIIQL